VEGTANGTFVADVGDIIFILGRYINQPMHCEVVDGRVVNIEGGVDALLLQEWLGAQNDDRVYEVGVFAWGTDHRARWDRVSWHFYEPAGVMDSESFYGNVRLGLGNNASAMLRGENRVKPHIDMQLRSCDVWVDDLQVIQSGEFTDPIWRHQRGATTG
jgi:2,5-dihydroxypyridine 5,6-dioxygenase